MPPRRLRVALAAGLAVLVAGCTGDSQPRFGMPAPATRQSHTTLHLWQGIFVTAIVVGAIVWGLIFWSVLRYRKRPGDDELPRQTRYHPIEFVYTAVPIVIVAVIFGFVYRAENTITHTVNNPPLTVKVEGFQWGWRFTYLRPDGSTIGTPVVGDQNNQPTLVLPAEETVQLNLVAVDVIHSFYVPDFLFKRDLIPKVNNTVDFYITKTGTFQGHCAEFCGLFHADMNFTVQAVSKDQFHIPGAGP
ncbi:MAG TPA: cytochrome c oxidase subunit II [Acidimicrobiales bacterium]|nr:cytochrome c oxidase subunit II [Acidimicrobiales bacterium]